MRIYLASISLNSIGSNRRGWKDAPSVATLLGSLGLNVEDCLDERRLVGAIAGLVKSC